MAYSIRHLRSIEAGNRRAVTAVAISSDGSELAVAAMEEIYLFDVATGHRNEKIVVDKPAVGLAWSPDERLVAAAFGDPTIAIYAIRRSEEVRQLRRDDAPDYLRADRQRQIAFFPDGKTLIAAGEDNSVTLWNLQSAQWDHIVRTTHGSGALQVSPGGSHVAVVGKAKVDEFCGHVTLYRRRLGLERVWTKAHAGDGRVTCAAFSPDGKRLATGGAGDGVRVWDVSPGQELAHLAADAADTPELSVFFVGDERHLVIVHGQRLDLRSSSTGASIATARHPGSDEIRGCAASDSGSILATFGAGPTVHCWSIGDETVNRHKK
jgi:WD40 repeat protein